MDEIQVSGNRKCFKKFWFFIDEIENLLQQKFIPNFSSSSLNFSMSEIPRLSKPKSNDDGWFISHCLVAARAMPCTYFVKRAKQKKVSERLAHFFPTNSIIFLLSHCSWLRKEKDKKKDRENVNEKFFILFFVL